MFNAFVLFTIIWVVVFFMSLPLGVYIPQKPKRGWASSAPEHSYIRRKLLWATFISVIVWGILYWLERKYAISIREWLMRGLG